jgi:uncharacterized protein YlxW (UPF0749 family)
MARNRLVSRMPVVALALLLGVGVLVQFRAQGRTSVVASDREAQALLLSELVEANGRLQAEIESLEAQLAIYQAGERGVGMQRLVTELNRVKVLTGLIEVSGPGIELLIDGPLSALDLQDIVNELRNAGAEAVALNGHRLVPRSVVTVETKGRLVVDGYSVARPYLFQAIGDPQTLESALSRPGGLLSLHRQSYPNLVATTTQSPHLVLGIHRSQGGR